MANKRGRRPKKPIAASDILSGLYLLRDDELKRHELSGRESVIAQHMLNGEGTTVIAKRLRLSVSGVKYHVRNILKKTKRKSREDFCVLIRRGIEASEREWRDRDAIREEAEDLLIIPEGRVPRV